MSLLRRVRRARYGLTAGADGGRLGRGRRHGCCNANCIGPERWLTFAQRRVGCRARKGEPQVEPDGQHPNRRLRGGTGRHGTPLEEVAVAVPTPSTEEHAVVPARAVPEGARHNGPGPDDEFLVALAKNGRTDAYDQLVRRYRRFVRV